MSKYIGRQSRADVRESRTGMRQSRGAMVIKIFFGIMFILVGVEGSPGYGRLEFFLTGLCLGGALIAWALIPFFKARTIRKQRNAMTDSLDSILESSPLHQNSNKTFADEQVEQLAKKYEDPELRL